jgi:lysophospholipase L1-like esterase
MKKILAKIFVFLLSILLALVILEIGLRLTGGLYNLYHNPNIHSRGINIELKKFDVLCLGDSYTYGVGTSPENSYPRQLERLLRQNVNKDINVINAGRLANTSSLLLHNFEEDIARYSPGIVIVMVGLSNRWNIRDSSYFILYKDKVGYFEKMNKVLSNLAIYKLIKIGYFNYQSGKSGNVSRKRTKVSQESLKLLSLGNDLYLNGRYDLAEKMLQRALALDKDNYEAQLLLVQIYRARSEFKKGREELWKTIANINEWDGNILYTVMHQIEMQEDSRVFKIKLSKMKQYIEAKYSGDNEQKRRLVRIIDARLGFLEDQQVQERVLGYDLEEIIKLAKSRGVTLILNTYPLNDLSLYDVFREISNKLNILLVDNFKVFKQIEQNGNKRDFFVSDGHCNAKGYGVIAENTYKTLVEHKLLVDHR